MEIKIGIMNVSRELTVESNDTSEQVLSSFSQALADGGVLTLKDEKGRTIAVPAASVGYLDLGSEQSRPVGFGTV
ncbi:DUF3107 domain-containing protein [Aestuariimicrobium ganziense]|uniref:DUF3107 domain-containing protein n=1 Tax=Aestuariimicrobium ganziense TaxID=2773677 RepID=UPI0019429C80|nr:DUF3107 domain-containing protein [Aestuariimicrobium ganziense]